MNRRDALLSGAGIVSAAAMTGSAAHAAPPESISESFFRYKSLLVTRASVQMTRYSQNIFKKKGNITLTVCTAGGNIVIEEENEQQRFMQWWMEEAYSPEEDRKMKEHLESIGY